MIIDPDETPAPDSSVEVAGRVVVWRAEKEPPRDVLAALAQYVRRGDGLCAMVLLPGQTIESLDQDEMYATGGWLRAEAIGWIRFSDDERYEGVEFVAHAPDMDFAAMPQESEGWTPIYRRKGGA